MAGTGGGGRERPQLLKRVSLPSTPTFVVDQQNRLRKLSAQIAGWSSRLPFQGIVDRFMTPRSLRFVLSLPSPRRTSVAMAEADALRGDRWVPHRCDVAKLMKEAAYLACEINLGR
uniref:Uncharacterized protein n=1 Tax=Plectus sambesii TaxID=2011161 RepID=A0A914W0Q1_9BILA